MAWDQAVTGLYAAAHGTAGPTILQCVADGRTLFDHGYGRHAECRQASNGG
eukprot:SAG11_NODE_7432_length_1144_cov_1.565550_1_plen_50_part_01